ncbi:heme ABC transporter ATP-binding protein [Gordonia sp. HY002]|uniref:heme ABC transporter ATP-binding protein n=1 Tax=Gordonia zhenghanii TaxID=2911516 RepID=UPI001EF0394D|nr:heme ABC transporter ATP-binding protein [Gordonia zhenghanii]MCF8569557.1 heme ABC transporter ATP-binding protein [Gordonia zhenghanii]MCF8603862.1 heme ABC transporter ATP-binding protein [Gordonia zhenghanii]
MVTATRPGAPISVDSVTVELGRRPVVRDVTFDVAPGELVALVGPNGCGKSTLLSAISGIRTPTSGRVMIGDDDVAHLDARSLARLRSLGTQSNRLDTPFTVREVVEMGRYPWTRTPEATHSEELIDAAVAECSLDDLVDRPFAHLSGGQQARVSLARSLAQHTPVLLLDEPTAALDIGHSEQVLSILSARAKAGATVLLVLHDLSLAAAYADRVAVMKDGLVRAVGPVPDVMTEELLSSTYDHPVMVFDHPETGERMIVPRR